MNIILTSSLIQRCLFVFSCLALAASCSAGKTAGSTKNNTCPAGEVKVDGNCHNVCAQIDECAFHEICNADGVCLEPADGTPPPAYYVG